MEQSMLKGVVYLYTGTRSSGRKNIKNIDTKLIQSILKSNKKNHKIIFISYKKILKGSIDYRIIDFTNQIIDVCFLGVPVQ